MLQLLPIEGGAWEANPAIGQWVGPGFLLRSRALSGPYPQTLQPSKRQRAPTSTVARAHTLLRCTQKCHNTRFCINAGSVSVTCTHAHTHAYTHTHTHAHTHMHRVLHNVLQLATPASTFLSQVSCTHTDAYSHVHTPTLTAPYKPLPLPHSQSGGWRSPWHDLRQV